ncbi:MAG: phosphoenolpyruvate synthase [Nanoarchaeota archaeon]
MQQGDKKEVLEKLNSISEKNETSNNPKPDFVKWFSELTKSSKAIAGGKGANLAEIYNLGIEVPPGFVVTAQAYNYFIDKAKLKEKILELLSKIDYEDTEQLDKITKQIRELITNAKIPEEMQEEIFESYEHLDAPDLDFANKTALDILNTASEPIFVAVRSSATAEDLAEASFAGQQDSFVNIKGNQELLIHIKKCFASLFTSRATYYRNKQGFKHEQTSLAVVVQKMVDSTKSGVIFSKDPSYKNDNIIIEAVYGLGEGIVSGKITPDKYVVSLEQKILDKKIADKKIAITRNSAGEKTITKLREEKSKSQVLNDIEIRNLTETAIKLEKHFKKPQDIEFAIEGEEIFIVQTRPVTTMKKRIEGPSQEIQGEPILTGLAASPGIASGKIKIIHKIKDLPKINKGDVLVTKMTNPDMVVTMQKSAAIVTDDGGLTAHASIVSREMGIPCIVGTKNATTKLKEGEIITVDGFKGKVYKGKVAETTTKEVLPVTAQTKTKIKVIVDLPSFAERAAKTNIKQIGLTRIEGIIAESGMHPQYFLEQNKINEYEEIIYKGIKTIAEPFEEIWVRSSDIRTDEFQNLKGAQKEKEANPMLGMHGIRYSLKYPEILKAELRALKRVAEGNDVRNQISDIKNQRKKIGVLFPQIISVDEIKKTKEIIKEINFSQLKFGVMVETPAAVQMIREICEEGIDFISFGTNDLTQYILALDRGNQEVQELYDEMHPAVLYQLEYVIRVCKRFNVETSICGQSGSKKEMVKFLVNKGIDSISVNADVAKEISDYVAELEKPPIEEQPRQYQPQDELQEPTNNQLEQKENIPNNQISNQNNFQKSINNNQNINNPQTPEVNNKQPIQNG